MVDTPNQQQKKHRPDQDADNPLEDDHSRRSHDRADRVSAAGSYICRAPERFRVSTTHQDYRREQTDRPQGLQAGWRTRGWEA